MIDRLCVVTSFSVNLCMKAASAYIWGGCVRLTEKAVLKNRVATVGTVSQLCSLYWGVDVIIKWVSHIWSACINLCFAESFSHHEESVVYTLQIIMPHIHSGVFARATHRVFEITLLIDKTFSCWSCPLQAHVNERLPPFSASHFYTTAHVFVVHLTLFPSSEMDPLC